MDFSPEKLTEKEYRQDFFRHLLRRVFIDDWLIKLFALIITLALWLGVTGLRAPTTARLRNVALNMLVSSDIEVTNSTAQEVDLVIVGDKRRIDQINQRDLIASLDLTGVQAGDRTVQLTSENINVELPTGIRLEEIQPNRIAVKLENVEEREIPVRAETEGSLADGFEIYNIAVSPAKVRVRGPESSVRSLDFVSTEAINLNNQSGNFTARQVPLNVVNPKVTVLDAVVDIGFAIGEKRIERLFVVPYETESRAGRASVLLFGARSIVENLQAESLQIVEEKTEDGKTNLRLALPAEIQDKVQVKSIKFRE